MPTVEELLLQTSEVNGGRLLNGRSRQRNRKRLETEKVIAALKKYFKLIQQIELISI